MKARERGFIAGAVARVAVAAAAAAVGACADTVSLGRLSDDAGASDAPKPEDIPPTMPRDVGASPDAAPSAMDAPTPPDGAAPFDAGAPAAPMCSGVRCAVGEECCLTTGRCFDRTLAATACPRPPQDARPERTCASNADCAATERCGLDLGGCLGAGHCVPRNNCGSCGSDCTVCGCDGVTYPSWQVACSLGVRVGAASGACGSGIRIPSDGGSDARAFPFRVPCANDSHCAGGQRCCAITGVCFDPACPGCCAERPPGTTFPCVTDAHCNPSEFCRGDGCGTPGGCAPVRGVGDCGGVVDAVCGCDGRTYVNECWALGSGVRVARRGACGSP